MFQKLFKKYRKKSVLISRKSIDNHKIICILKNITHNIQIPVQVEDYREILSRRSGISDTCVKG